MRMGEGLKQAYEIFSSRKTALVLFSGMCLASLPGTFAEKSGIYSHPLFISLLALLTLNLLVCTVRRIRSLPRPVMVLHSGVALTLIGAAVGASGYVATVNVYEGKSVDKAFRWDIRKDAPLGMDLTVNSINVEHYPAQVKVGVLKDGSKHRLITSRTGETFDLENYQVRIDSLDLDSKNLRLSVYNQGHYLGYAETAGKSELPPGFEYAFVLVAYKDPELKRTWLELLLSDNGRLLAEGATEVNSPFEWQGLAFHHTKTDVDAYGNPYAGIQITKDPGKQIVYLGFFVTCIGASAYLIRRLRGLG